MEAGYDFVAFESEPGFSVKADADPDNGDNYIQYYQIAGVIWR